MKVGGEGFKDRFFLFLTFSFGAMLISSMLLVFLLVNESSSKSERSQIASKLELYEARVEDRFRSFIRVLDDYSSNSIILNPVMQFNPKDLALRDYLDGLNVLGKKGKFSIYSFDEQVIYGDSKVSSAALKKILNSEEEFVIELSDEEKSIWTFMVPVLYAGIPEGVLVFQANIKIKELIPDLTKESNLELELNSKKLVWAPVDGKGLSSISKNTSLGISIHFYYDKWNFIKEKYASIFTSFFSLLVILFFLGAYFYKRGKTEFVDPHEELIKTQNKLSIAASYNEIILNSAEHLFISTDLEGTVLTFNSSAEEKLGYRAEEIIGLHTPALWHDLQEVVEKTKETNERLGVNLEPGFETFVFEARETKKPVQGEWTLKARNGNTFPVSLTVTAMFEGKEVIGYLGIIEDITEKKLAREKRIQAVKEIERAAQVKSEFLANMSHEIRTPMNGILGMVNMLRDTTLTEKQKDMLGVIRSSGDGLMTILNDILDLSKMDSGKMELEYANFSILDCVKEAVVLSRPKAQEKNLEIGFNISGNTPEFFFGDITRIRQILVNLLSNAVKFTESGEVRVDVESKDMDNGQHKVVFHVKDSGIGISEEDQGKLFKAFSQADASITRRFGGTGLGLAIISKLVGLMNGQVTVDSTLGKGSVFSFELELKEGEIPKQNLESMSVGNSISDIKTVYDHKILVVEDNAINQKLVRMMLEKMHYTCDIVGNGIECLKALEDIKKVDGDEYTLIFMDMQMPEMDGITATKEIINKYGEDRPVIVAMTANAFKEDREKCIQAGMDGFLSKPINVGELVQILDLYAAALQLPSRKIEDFKKEGSTPASNTLNISRSSKDHFEKDGLLKSFMGDESILFELVDDFGEQWPQYIEKMKSHLEEEDYENLEIVAHTLKGLTGTFKAQHARELAIALEAFAKKKEKDRIGEAISALDEELKALQSDLNKLAA